MKTTVISVQRVAFKITFTDDVSSFKIESKNVATEYDALENRNTYGSDTEKLYDYLTKMYKVDKSSVQTSNAEDPKLPYIYSFSAEETTEVFNDKIFITPFLREPVSENPLKQENRNYPIDMNYPSGKIYFSEILIPKGFKVDFIPESCVVKNDLFEMLYSVNVKDDKINVSCNYSFNKAIYPSSDYNEIKSYMSLVVKKANEKIVLSKI